MLETIKVSIASLSIYLPIIVGFSMIIMAPLLSLLRIRKIMKEQSYNMGDLFGDEAAKKVIKETYYSGGFIYLYRTLIISGILTIIILSIIL